MREAVRQSLLADNSNRFFYDEEKNVLHDRLCRQVEKIKESKVKPLSELNSNYMKTKKLCIFCRRRLAIRNGMQGYMKYDEKQLKLFMVFLGQVGAKDDDLINLFVRNEGRLAQISADMIGIKVREDWWRISKHGGRLELFHNNYTTDKACNRIFDGKYHRQYDFGLPTFQNFTRIICGYTFAYHKKQLEEYNRKVQKYWLESNLALIDNYMQEDRRSLMFHYYTFVDIDNRTCEKTKDIRFKPLKLIDAGEDYSVVTCRILKWENQSFRSMMQKLKKQALEEERKEYIGVCESAIRQIV